MHRDGRKPLAVAELNAVFFQAQPNRKTGICETDVMAISSETTPEFRLCGLNNGQHSELPCPAKIAVFFSVGVKMGKFFAVYYDVEDVKGDVNIVMNLTREGVGRLWEIKVRSEG